MKKSIITLAVGLSLASVAEGYSVDLKQTPTASQAQEVATDQLIIKYKKGVDVKSKTSAKTMANFKALSAVELAHKRFNFENAQIVKLNGFKSRKALQGIIKHLEADPDVASVELDVYTQPLATANDPRYAEQWHYHEALGGINLERAWDLSTGSGVNIAVVDTGYLAHEDLVGNIVGGYDFVSDADRARDGDGRDPSALDEGDWFAAFDCGLNFEGRDSSWHGSHVAGTIGAVTNNGIGVAGVAYNANIIPVRVLAQCGGSGSDVADGIVWASGGSVSGVPANPNPSKVINISLGGKSACSSTYQNAINVAKANGSVVVVAAGNSDIDASEFAPANCDGVITVAATNREANRAGYSNFGETIEIAAPGGGYDDTRILSTIDSGNTTPAGDAYGQYAGTSMATPHVAGVLGLMFSANPSLTVAEAEQALLGSVRPFPSGSDCNVSNCGEGLLDAEAALLAVTDGTPPTNEVPVANFTFSCTDLVCDFDGSASSDSDGSIVSYSWSFGATGVTASNTFASSGSYTVTLTVADDDGASNAVSKVVTVSEGSQNEAPVAAFTYSCTDLSCDFDGSGSSDDNGVTSYDWSFGATGATASHTFSSAGSYTVTLTVTDAEGLQDNVSQTVTVTEPDDGNSNIVLAGSRYFYNFYTLLMWVGAEGANVDVYRDGTYIGTTANDGAVSDSVPNASATYIYKVCEEGSTTNCSNEVVSAPE